MVREESTCRHRDSRTTAVTCRYGDSVWRLAGRYGDSEHQNDALNKARPSLLQIEKWGEGKLPSYYPNFLERVRSGSNAENFLTTWKKSQHTWRKFVLWFYNFYCFWNVWRLLCVLWKYLGLGNDALFLSTQYRQTDFWLAISLRLASLACRLLELLCLLALLWHWLGSGY